MRKNNILRAAALLLACCMFSLCTITGTMAHYIGNFTPNAATVRAGIFRVAVQLNDKEDSWIVLGEADLGTPIEADMFTTLFEDDVETEENLTDIHVTEATTGAGIIAPGTGGKLKITVVNYSEVDVLVTVEMGDSVETTRPIKWLDEASGEWGYFFPEISTSDAVELKNFPEAGGSLLAPPLGASAQEFSWKWEFERPTLGEAYWYYQKDAYDTALGIDAADPNTDPRLITIPITITAEQIN